VISILSILLSCQISGVIPRTNPDFSLRLRQRLFPSQRQRPEIRPIFPVEVFLAFMRAVVGGIRVDPGYDPDELLAGHIHFARGLADLFDQLALVRTERQWRF